MLPLNPPTVRHLGKARHNFRLFEKLRSDGQYLDWSVTALFYAALHLVDASAAQTGFLPFQAHEDRRLYVRDDLSALWRPYCSLENASPMSRYELRDFTNPEVEELLKHYRRIEGHLRARGIS